jgi:hypothetical protein
MISWRLTDDGEKMSEYFTREGPTPSELFEKLSKLFTIPRLLIFFGIEKYNKTYLA